MDNFRPEIWVTLPDRLFSTRKYPELQYFAITKCGCTFVKNLLWRIDHDSDHDDALRIHRNDRDFPKAGQLGYTMEQIRTMEYSFVILRDPVDRFLSLYFDKILGPGAARFIPLRQVLLDGYGLIPDPSTLDEHRTNCHILLRWLETNLKGKSELPRDAHWLPQAQRFRIIRSMDLKVILLDDLAARLAVLLSPLIPDIAQLMQGVERNTAPRPVPHQALLTDALRDEINTLYARDARAVQTVAAHWEQAKPASGRDYPRFTQLL